MQGQHVDPTTAAILIETIALAIEYAHQRGIVHRDLKPANILMQGLDQTPLRDCVPKITDFGLAKQMNEDVRLTQTGVVLGTPCYMAPEQVENPTAEVTAAVDVYGLGALLYELLTGRPPFSAATNFETMRQVVTDKPMAPSHWQPSTPAALDRICLKCLEKVPTNRYASAGELADDIARYLEGERPTAVDERPSVVRRRQRRIPSPGSVVLPKQSWFARNWQLVALMVMAALFGAGGVAGIIHLRSDIASANKDHHETPAALPIGEPAAPPPIRIGVLHSLSGTMAISEQGVVVDHAPGRRRIECRGWTAGAQDRNLGPRRPL